LFDLVREELRVEMSYRFVIICNHRAERCRNEFSPRLQYDLMAEVEAQRAGWQRTGKGLHLCPEHRQ
jgi:hypothetical protein